MGRGSSQEPDAPHAITCEREPFELFSSRPSEFVEAQRDAYCDQYTMKRGSKATAC